MVLHGLQTGDCYAVKLLPKVRENVEEEVVQSKIKREVEIFLTSQECPNVVDLYCVFEDEDSAMLVMEELPGGSLGDFVFSDRKMSEQEMAYVCHDILSAIHHLHTKGVVYGDVKPTNFLFTNNILQVSYRPVPPDPAALAPALLWPDDPHRARLHHRLQWEEGKEAVLPTMVGMRPRGMHLKIVDFGCSQWYRPGHILKSRTGTPVYIAPEVLLREYGPAADVWSVGMMMYHLVARRLPYWPTLRGLTPQMVMKAILHEPISFDLPEWDAVAPECLDLLELMLDHSPDCRLTAAAALSHPWFVRMGVITEDEAAARERALPASAKPPSRDDDSPFFFIGA